MSRLLILFLSIGLIACQQQSDTAAEAPVATSDAAGPKLYVFDCGIRRIGLLLAGHESNAQKQNQKPAHSHPQRLSSRWL